MFYLTQGKYFLRTIDDSPTRDRNTSFIRHIQDLMPQNIHLLKELLKPETTYHPQYCCNRTHYHIIWRNIGQILGKPTGKYVYSQAMLINTTGRDLIINCSDEELTEEASHKDLDRRVIVSKIRWQTLSAIFTLQRTTNDDSLQAGAY